MVAAVIKMEFILTMSAISFVSAMVFLRWLLSTVRQVKVEPCLEARDPH